ncbi:MAG: outer membrane protein transport protein [Acidobacteria bacterium]|nr:outer membrane protein transport protein [Acidobacteriota bacterium]
MICDGRPSFLRSACLGALVLGPFLGLSGPAQAQPLTIPRFDFSFSNPGARSLGLGGAFAALADDATAAYANPAGLVQLTEAEVSVEARLWGRSPTFLAGGRFDGQPSGSGVDTDSTILVGRDRSEDLGPSFVSLVLPKKRWCFALYGHQTAKFRQMAESQGFFFDDEFEPGGVGRFPATRESVDLEVTSLGAAAGWRFNDGWSLGLGLVFSDTSLDTRTDAFLPDDDSPAAQTGPISFLPERRLSTTTVRAKGTQVTVTGGLLWRPSERFSAGLFYRQGAEVDGSYEVETGPVLPFEDRFSTRAVFSVPTVAGAGVAYRCAGGRLTLAAEVDRVSYSGLVEIVENDEVSVEGREYQDAWDYRAGAELALLRRSPILAFRTGIWIEDNGQDLLRKDFTHYTAGLGLAAESFQIDLGADLSEEIDTLSLSFIYRL